MSTPDHQTHPNSLRSYEELKKSGRALTIEKKVLFFLEKCDGEPMSTRQLAKALAIEKNSLTAPLLALRKRGDLFEESRPCATTRRTVMHLFHKKRREPSPTLFSAI